MISFSTPEHNHIHRTTDWYVAVCIVGIAITIASILLGNVMFGILILVATGTICIMNARPPHMFHVDINEHGVVINKKFYRIENIAGFAVLEEEHPPTLVLEINRSVLPYIYIPLTDVDPLEVKMFLGQYIPEVTHEIPLLVKLTEYLGF